MTHDPEADRLRAAYARRDRLGLDARYDYWRPDNLFSFQARERAVLDLLAAAGFLPMAGRRVLDVGCGDGAVLLDMLRYGASAIHADRPEAPDGSTGPPDFVRPELVEGRVPDDALELHGIDMLPDRVASARA